MAYSDKDLRTFTQIAYTNFSDAAEILVKDSDNGNVDCTIANLESKTNPPKDGYPYNLHRNFLPGEVIGQWLAFDKRVVHSNG